MEELMGAHNLENNAKTYALYRMKIEHEEWLTMTHESAELSWSWIDRSERNQGS